MVTSRPHRSTISASSPADGAAEASRSSARRQHLSSIQSRDYGLIAASPHPSPPLSSLFLPRNTLFASILHAIKPNFKNHDVTFLGSLPTLRHYLTSFPDIHFSHIPEHPSIRMSPIPSLSPRLPLLIPTPSPHYPPFPFSISSPFPHASVSSGKVTGSYSPHQVGYAHCPPVYQ